MDPEGIEPTSSANSTCNTLEAEILPLNYGSTISGILLNSDSSMINILFLPIKNLSFFGIFLVKYIKAFFLS